MATFQTAQVEEHWISNWLKSSEVRENLQD